MTTTKRVDIASGNPDGIVLVLPGILARSAEQYAPLVSVLEPYGSITGYDYTPGYQMHAAEVINMVCGDIKQAVSLGKSVTLIGSSMGGMQIPFINNWHGGIDLSSIPSAKIIIVDAPTGASTMKQVLLGSFGGHVIASPLGQLFKPLASLKIGPQDALIDVPETDLMLELAGQILSEEDWRQWVKDMAIAGLTGHSARLWLSQLRWMLYVGRSGLLGKSCEKLRDVDTTYIACTGPGNDVVDQPAAADWWQAAAFGTKIIEVSGVHCGYLQQVQLFRDTIAKALAS